MAPVAFHFSVLVIVEEAVLSTIQNYCSDLLKRLAFELLPAEDSGAEVEMDDELLWHAMNDIYRVTLREL